MKYLILIGRLILGLALIVSATVLVAACVLFIGGERSTPWYVPVAATAIMIGVFKLDRLLSGEELKLRDAPADPVRGFEVLPPKSTDQ